MPLRSLLNARSFAATATATIAPRTRVAVPVPMRRRVLGFLAAAGMVAVVTFGTVVPASATPAESFTVDDITYTVTSEGSTVAVTAYGKAGGHLDIPSSVEYETTDHTVTSIGYGAFDSKALDSVTIPDSVISIDAYAFAFNALKSVTIPDSVTSIGLDAFSTNLLESVTIGHSLTSIDDGVFSSNELTSVTIPDSVTSIGYAAFRENSLVSVSIPDSVRSLGGAAFRENSLESVTIPDSVTTISSNAFANNSLESVTIPDSVSSIGSYAFDSNKLVSVTIPDSVTTISSSAFANNSLESVSIPDSVTSIGDGAFGDNSSLRSVIFDGPAATVGTGNALGDQAAVQVYYYARYGADAVAGGFTAPKWHGYTTSVLEMREVVVSLDLDVNVGDTVAGAPVAVSVEGLLEGSAYAVVVRSTPTTIASGLASPTGTVSDASGRMPSGLAAGPHTVTFTGTDTDGKAVSRVAYLTVSDTGTVTYLSYSAAESAVLAATGFDAAPFGAAALLLLLAGVALTLRRQTPIATS